MTVQLNSTLCFPMQTFPGGNIVMPVCVLRGRRRICEPLPDEIKEVHSESMPPLIALHLSAWIQRPRLARAGKGRQRRKRKIWQQEQHS